MESPGPRAASTPFRAESDAISSQNSRNGSQNLSNASFDIISSSQKRKLSPLKANNSLSKKKRYPADLQTLASSSFKDDIKKILENSVNLSTSKLTRSIYKKFANNSTSNARINVKKSNDYLHLNASKVKIVESKKLHTKDLPNDEKQEISNRLSNGKRLSNNNSSKPSFIRRKLYSAISDYTDSDKTPETSFLDKNTLPNIYNSKKSTTSNILVKTGDKLDSNKKDTEYSLRKGNKNFKQYFDDNITHKSQVFTTIPKENTCQFIAGLLKGINNESQDTSEKEKVNMDDKISAFEESDNMFILNDTEPSIDKSNNRTDKIKQTKIKISRKNKSDNKNTNVKKAKIKNNSAVISPLNRRRVAKKSPPVKKVNNKKGRSLQRSNVAEKSKRSISPMKNIRSSKSKKEKATVRSELDELARYNKVPIIKDVDLQSKLRNISNKYLTNDLCKENCYRPIGNNTITSKYSQSNISYYDSRGEPINHRFPRNCESNMQVRRYNPDLYNNTFSRNNERSIHVKTYAPDNNHQHIRNNQSNMHLQSYVTDNNRQFSRNDESSIHLKKYASDNNHQFIRNNQSSMHLQRYAMDNNHTFSRNEESNMQLKRCVPYSNHQFRRNNQSIAESQRYIPDMSMSRFGHGTHLRNDYHTALVAENNTFFKSKSDMSLCQSSTGCDSMMHPNMSYRDATLIMNEKVLRPPVKKKKTYKIDITTDTRIEVMNACNDGFKIPIGYSRKLAITDPHMDIREKYAGVSCLGNSTTAFNQSKSQIIRRDSEISNRSTYVYRKNSFNRSLFNSNRNCTQAEVFDKTMQRINTRVCPESVLSDSQNGPFTQLRNKLSVIEDDDDRIDFAGPSRNKEIISEFLIQQKNDMHTFKEINEREVNEPTVEYTSTLNNNREIMCVSPILQKPKKPQFNTSHDVLPSKIPFSMYPVASKNDVCDSPGLQKYGISLNVKPANDIPTISRSEQESRISPVFSCKIRNKAKIKDGSPRSSEDSWIAVKKTPLNCSPWRFTG